MPYTVIKTEFPEVLILEPKVFGDERGFFYESFNQRDFESATGLAVVFVQDNHSKSSAGVLRGLHYQIEHAQGKLVRVTHGEILDVAVDMRLSSPNFGKWISVVLSASNKLQVWIPSGFAHGLIVTSDSAEVMYKATDYWYPEYERSVLWSDPDLGIDWRFSGAPILAAKDAAGKRLSEAEAY